MSANTDPQSLVGSVLADRYKILRLIGQGGWGVVYEGVHTLMDREVAIKFLRSQYLEDSVNRKRFQQEAQAVSRLNHPNVIGVHDFGMTPEGHHYLVMDLVKGTTLDNLLDSEAFLPAERALPIFLQVCAGLAHAHENGIIHRDLKPGNIMIVPAGDDREVAKILDFGVAKVVPKLGSQSEQLTRTGEIFGTSLYLSPEQCMGKKLDGRSDLYALGCVMYETLTALPPHIGDNLLDTLQKHIADPVVPLRKARSNSDVPEQLEHVILKVLSKDPAERYQTAAELQLALERVRLSLESDRVTSQLPVRPPAADEDASDDPPQESDPAAKSQRPPTVTTDRSFAPTENDSTSPPNNTEQAPVATDSKASSSAPAAHPAGLQRRSNSLRLIGLLAVGAVLGGLGSWLALSTLQPASTPPAGAPSGTAEQLKNAELAWKQCDDDGQHAFDDGKYEEAQMHFLNAVTEAEKLGDHNPKLLSSLRKLSDVYYTRGMDAEAEKIDERIRLLKSAK